VWNSWEVFYLIFTLNPVDLSTLHGSTPASYHKVMVRCWCLGYFRSRRWTRFHVVNQRCFISVLCSTLHSASRLQPLMTCVRSMSSTVDCFLPSKSYNHCNVVGSCSLAVKLLVESTLHVVNDDLVFSVPRRTANCFNCPAVLTSNSLCLTSPVSSVLIFIYSKPMHVR